MVAMQVCACSLTDCLTCSGNWHPRPPAGINMTLGFSRETGNLKFEVTAETPSPGSSIVCSDVVIICIILFVFVCVRACMCACVRMCVVCVCACVRACINDAIATESENM